MSGYFYTLLVTSVCGAVCAMLAHGGFERYIKYIASLVCLVIMISPFRDIDALEISAPVSAEISGAERIFDTTLYKTSAELTETRVEEYISEIVFNKFGIKPVYTDIKIDWTKEEAVIECISVALSKADTEQSEETEKYLSELFGGEVTVVEV